MNRFLQTSALTSVGPSSQSEAVLWKIGTNVLYSCFTVRAVHIQMAYDLSTSSFINSFRRFIGRRGLPKRVLSDNGTNFVGAE